MPSVTTVTMSMPSISEETMNAAGLERHQPSAMRHRSLQHDMGIDPHQFAVVIGVTIAGARRAWLDVAHHRAGIAADLVVGGSRRITQHEQALKPASNCRISQIRSDASSTSGGLDHIGSAPPGVF